ncbi:MAG: glycosyltransferase [Chloroflexi bacterium]|nr:glycosyltransferase [Chloroflexota bacterium]
MNILMMFHFSPNPPPNDLGPSKRSVPFLNEALKRHNVSVLSFGSAEEERIFRQHYTGTLKRIVFVNTERPRLLKLLRRVYALLTGKGFFHQLYRSQMQKELDALVRTDSFDVIYCATALLGCYRFPKGIPLVGDTHNVEHDILRRSVREARDIFSKLYWFVEYKIGKRRELRFCRKFDVLTTTTERDASIFRTELPGCDIKVISNGVDPLFLQPMDARAEQNTMVFTGLMSYLPNPHGVAYFLDDVLPLISAAVPDAKVYIVGKDPPKWLRAKSSDKVIVTGFVEDVRPYIARGQVFIIPLLIGGGIRGKALEAMAMRKAIVSTSVGYEGIPLENGKTVLVGDTPREFADAVMRLFRDPLLRSALGESAHKLVLEKYNWVEKGAELDGVFRSVATRGARDATLQASSVEREPVANHSLVARH